MAQLTTDHVYIRAVFPVAYTSPTRPTPFSALRQLVYQSESLMVGPEIDPAGWETLCQTKVSGVLFNRVQTSVTCSVCSGCVDDASAEYLDPAMFGNTSESFLPDRNSLIDQCEAVVLVVRRFRAY